MGMYFNKNPKRTSVGYNDSNGVLTMSVSVIVPEKQRGQKSVTKNNN